MLKEIINTSHAPAPVGPYSQAVKLGSFLFCSGQISLDSNSGNLILGNIKAQTTKVMENVGAVLKAAGLDYSHIIKSTIFLTDMDDFSDVNEVYSTYFTEQPPARSCVEVSRLPKGVNVEVEVIAHQ